MEGERKIEGKTTPIVVLVIGMAGSGKTTLMHRINLYMQINEKRAYYINLDPAVRSVPFAVNIDIKDTVDYKEVMSEYQLGPNGGILTSLNLFATRFDQVIEILEKRADNLDYIFIDTPGQIEVFTWSAGGQIILELLASTFPTTLLYISDTTRCTSPTTFMSNMLYCCSVLYKSRIPIISVFNKIDIIDCKFALEWMSDFETYLNAIENDGSNENDIDARAMDGEYMGSLNRSLALVMDEFYKAIRSVGVSASTGEGIDKLFVKIQEAAVEFQEVYFKELQKKIQDKKDAELERQTKDLQTLRKDLNDEKQQKQNQQEINENNKEGEYEEGEEGEYEDLEDGESEQLEVSKQENNKESSNDNDNNNNGTIDERI